MAEERFVDALRQLVTQAAAEGLDNNEMKRILEELLEKGTDNERKA